MRRAANLLASLEVEDRLAVAGIACLAVAGGLVHVALGLATVGLGLLAASVARARVAAPDDSETAA